MTKPAMIGCHADADRHEQPHRVTTRMEEPSQSADDQACD
jgi:hypothetical protein